MKMHWIKMAIKLNWNIRHYQHQENLPTKIEKERSSGSSSLQSEYFNKYSTNLSKVNR